MGRGKASRTTCMLFNAVLCCVVCVHTYVSLSVHVLCELQESSHAAVLLNPKPNSIAMVAAGLLGWAAVAAT